jgi:hypothetical protein
MLRAGGRHDGVMHVRELRVITAVSLWSTDGDYS